jgi:hypothetical protein
MLTDVRVLDAQYLSIGTPGGRRLAAVLPSLRALTHLDLYHNDIGAAGTAALAGALPFMAALTRLDLGCN